MWNGLRSKSSLFIFDTFYLIEICVYLFPSSYVEALIYLIYSYQYNKELLLKGMYRGHSEKLLGFYRRECLLVSNFRFLREANVNLVWQISQIKSSVSKRALSVLQWIFMCSVVHRSHSSSSISNFLCYIDSVNLTKKTFPFSTDLGSDIQLLFLWYSFGMFAAQK